PRRAGRGDPRRAVAPRVQAAGRHVARLRRLRADRLHPDGLLPRPVPVPAAHARAGEALMDVRMFTVGPVQENCFVARRDGADRAVIVDPGDEADRILHAVDELGVTVDAILLTHTHFDHVGAVAPVAKATGAPVYCPKLETFVLADINSFVPFAGF